MRKISSILPSNSRISTVDLSAGPSRRPGAYNPLEAGSEKPKPKASLAPMVAGPPSGLKLDKVTLSPEAQKVQGEIVTAVADPQTSVLATPEAQPEPDLTPPKQSEL